MVVFIPPVASSQSTSCFSWMESVSQSIDSSVRAGVVPKHVTGPVVELDIPGVGGPNLVT
jgi:hypothetical protein